MAGLISSIKSKGWIQKILFFVLIYYLLTYVGFGARYRRTQYTNEQYFYRAYVHQANNTMLSTRHDFHSLGDIIKGPKSEMFAGLEIIVGIIAFPFYIADIPISLITDVICLPHDIRDYNQKTKSLGKFKALLRVDEEALKTTEYKDYANLLTRLNQQQVGLEIKKNKEVARRTLYNFSYLLKGLQKNRTQADIHVYDWIIRATKILIQKEGLDTAILTNLYHVLKIPPREWDLIPYYFEDKEEYKYLIQIYNHEAADKELRAAMIEFFALSPGYVRFVSLNGYRPGEINSRYFKDSYYPKRGPAQHPSLTSEDLAELVEKYDNTGLFRDILNNPAATPETISRIYKKGKNRMDVWTLSAISVNPNTPKPVLADMLDSLDQLMARDIVMVRILDGFANNKTLAGNLLTRTIQAIIHENRSSSLEPILENHKCSLVDEELIFEYATAPGRNRNMQYLYYLLAVNSKYESMVQKVLALDNTENDKKVLIKAVQKENPYFKGKNSKFLSDQANNLK